MGAGPVQARIDRLKNINGLFIIGHTESKEPDQAAAYGIQSFVRVKKQEMPGDGRAHSNNMVTYYPNNILFGVVITK